MGQACAPARQPGPTENGPAHVRRPDWTRWRNDGLTALIVLSIWLAAFAADLLMSLSSTHQVPMGVIFGLCGGLLAFGAGYGLRPKRERPARH